MLELAAPVVPRHGVRWPEYKQQVEEKLRPGRERVSHLFGLALHPLYAANAIYGRLTSEHLREIRRGALGPSLRLLEWNLEVEAGQIANVARHIGWAPPRSETAGLSGQGVRVAVLDSGIDLNHPFLRVADAVSTCEEDVHHAGRHGTFCAGVIASRHPHYRGIAAEVDLINVKTSRSDGVTTAASLAKGIDEALDRRADVLSMSCGLNQSDHQWKCLDGYCLLCGAVDHAVACGAVVVAAAGNLHRRTVDPSNRPRTELLCPAQARSALTVGAMESLTFPKLYGRSSHGPTAYGLLKPDLVAPGGGVLSTVPAVSGEQRDSALFKRESGTSVAAAVVAGAVALLIEKRRREGKSWTPEGIREELLSRHVRRLDGQPPEAVGAGGMDLAGLC